MTIKFIQITHHSALEDAKKYFDLIFVGIEYDFSHINVAVPVKKKHHCNLTKKEKLYN